MNLFNTALLLWIIFKLEKDQGVKVVLLIGAVMFGVLDFLIGYPSMKEGFSILMGNAP